MTNKYDAVLKAIQEVWDAMYESGFLSEDCAKGTPDNPVDVSGCQCAACAITQKLDEVEQFFIRRAAQG